MNCFQISIFAVHEQPNKYPYYSSRVVNCFQISIFAVHEQLVFSNIKWRDVVNCFQISIFAVHEQHGDAEPQDAICCELLSN